MATSIGPNASLGLSTLPQFAARFSELGWICQDHTNIHPTNGSLSSGSLIVPINFFAHQVTLTDGPGGTASGGFLLAHESGLLPMAVSSDLKANRESRYFSL
jgi:hypothetical protein